MTKRPDVRAMMGHLARKLSASQPKPAKAKRKKLPKVISEKPKASNVVALVPSAKAPQKISAEVLVRARVPRRRPGAPNPLPGQARPNPFILPTFPKGVGPSATSTTGGMAMDEAPGLAWAQSQVLYAGSFWEGQYFFGYSLLAELAQRPEYRRISERIATEATRKWIKLQATSNKPTEPGQPAKKPKATDAAKAAKIAKIEDEMKRLHVEDRFRELCEQDGFFGRSHLYLDVGDGADADEMKMPIGNGRDELSKLKCNPTKPLIAIRTVEAAWCSPGSYNSNDPLSPLWYKPQTWYVMSREVHRSRLLTFVAREVPDLLKPAYAFGGLPMTQMARPYVDNWLRTRQGVSDLVASFSTMILQTNMQATLAGDGSSLYTRLDLYNLLRDNHGIMALDKDTEDLKNVTTPLGTLDALQAQSQEQMASVSGIPIVILLGIQPMGLNASSEGEIRVFYDFIAAYQKAFLSDKLTTVINFIQLSLFGEVDPEITFRWEPLWSLDAKERAEARKMNAETDLLYVDGSVLHPEEVRAAVAADAESPYASIDVDDVPEPPEEEYPFGGGLPGGDTPDGTPGPSDPSGAQRKEPGAAADALIPFVASDEINEAAPK